MTTRTSGQPRSAAPGRRRSGYRPSQPASARAVAARLLLVGVAPATVTTAWTAINALLAAAYGQPSRASLETRPRVWASWGRTPYTQQELQLMAPDEAASVITAWRRDPNKPLVGPRELARTLQIVVKSAPGAMGRNPVENRNAPARADVPRVLHARAR